MRGVTMALSIRLFSGPSDPLRPLPPFVEQQFVEQQRLVAEVYELMALCDRLEAGLDATDGTRNRLLHDTLTPSAYEAATVGAVGA